MQNQKNKAAGLCTLTASKKLLQPNDTSIVKRYATPESCPKFQACNAPICILDSDWHKRSNHSEDATCFYLAESVKDGAETHFQVAGLGELYQQILRVRPDIIQRHSRIARKLEIAKQSGSRMARKVGSGA